jgi:long-chain acyl-CoA synthetase
VTSNTPKHRKLGAVGRPLPGVRVAIDESRGQRAGEGEVLVYGDNVMVGYHDRPEETRAVLTADGGLRTGDLGVLDAQGFLTITGRLKELYKLENGRYIAPVALEEALKVSPFISNIVIYGADKPYNVAVVVPDKERLARRLVGGEVTLPEQPLEELLQAEIDRLSTPFKSYERPRALLIADEDFTSANGLLTPKLSTKRREVVTKYQSQLDALYSAR